MEATGWALVVVCVLMSIHQYYCRKKVKNLVKKSTDNKAKVLIVTAHPDDECMFFTPTILSLCRQPEYDLHLLCLSTGNYYNQGETRQKELHQSCTVLGISKENVFVEDRSEFPDDPNANWDKEELSLAIGAFVKRHKIDIVLTFDEHGVSGHTNHKALFSGVRHLLTKPGFGDLIGYALISTSVLRKYVSIADLVPSVMIDSKPIFIGTWADIRTGFRSMYAHYTQFVWFRMLYITFSRYMVINTFQEIHSGED